VARLTPITSGLALSAAASGGVVWWLAVVFEDLPVRYVSMLGTRSVALSSETMCPAIASSTVDAFREEAVLPLTVFVLASAVAVVLGARRSGLSSAWSRPVLMLGLSATAVGAAFVYGAVSLDTLADGGLRFVLPLPAALALIAAVLLRSDPSAPQSTFVLVHSSVIACLVPSAVAWLTPTHEALVCM
jgi:hypothetical protein